ncbi:MAG: scyllo-inositol 2-dehydrogenase (NAD(+)) [Candidatus Moanabacter tarae]|uniref:Scyllo-inositol 2-dehydrogenase (NAD(+)) n=1 Tax=Candidatus Moanibacter tarae TaxID=2200854 RepID=A0A2Z4AK82_9BACT|nr:MAG: scyllo-inositol 2-dehydrogenase (NAD(+)) [Candidatus Moanabacter tarae]|tara:strand:+ start:59899 stop:60894 length:996 start_codon:yes stop_codon:yes gene_type:complete
MYKKIRWAQYGTKHGHAAGKLLALQRNPQVEVIGVYEPDPNRREEVSNQKGPFSSCNWFNDPSQILDDASIVAVASEGSNSESLDQTESLIEAGKHVWYDKPAGNNWQQWQRIVRTTEERSLHIQMGYMLRYHPSFKRIAKWARSGLLGEITSVRGHMSSSISKEKVEPLKVFKGGIFFDLGAHMLDQVIWLLGRPEKITPFFRTDSDAVGVVDNSLAVFETTNAIAYIDISSFETKPAARRFEVYGTQGSAIILEPFEPGPQIRLCLDQARGGYSEGEQIVREENRSRQDLYELELAAFLASISGDQEPDRPLSHELLVQEILLRTCDYL